MQNTYMNKMLQKIAEAVEKWTQGSITIDVTGAGDMAGASGTSPGAHGLVPAPAAGDQDKVLSGSGAWIPQSGGGNVEIENILSIPTDGASGNIVALTRNISDFDLLVFCYHATGSGNRAQTCYVVYGLEENEYNITTEYVYNQVYTGIYWSWQGLNIVELARIGVSSPVTYDKIIGIKF